MKGLREREDVIGWTTTKHKDRIGYRRTMCLREKKGRIRHTKDNEKNTH